MGWRRKYRGFASRTDVRMDHRLYLKFSNNRRRTRSLLLAQSWGQTTQRQVLQHTEQEMQLPFQALPIGPLLIGNRPAKPQWDIRLNSLRNMPSEEQVPRGGYPTTRPATKLR